MYTALQQGKWKGRDRGTWWPKHPLPRGCMHSTRLPMHWAAVLPSCALHYAHLPCPSLQHWLSKPCSCVYCCCLPAGAAVGHAADVLAPGCCRLLALLAAAVVGAAAAAASSKVLDWRALCTRAMWSVHQGWKAGAAELVGCAVLCPVPAALPLASPAAAASTGFACASQQAAAGCRACCGGLRGAGGLSAPGASRARFFAWAPSSAVLCSTAEAPRLLLRREAAAGAAAAAAAGCGAGCRAGGTAAGPARLAAAAACVLMDRRVAALPCLAGTAAAPASGWPFRRPDLGFTSRI